LFESYILDTYTHITDQLLHYLDY